MRIEIPMRVVSEANQSMSGNWWSKVGRVKEQRNCVWHWMYKFRGKLPFPARVTLTRIGPRLLDSDNLQGAFKAVRDEVAAAIGQDDGNPSYEWAYKQVRGKPKQYAIVIEIEQI